MFEYQENDNQNNVDIISYSGNGVNSKPLDKVKNSNSDIFNVLMILIIVSTITYLGLLHIYFKFLLLGLNWWTLMIFGGGVVALSFNFYCKFKNISCLEVEKEFKILSLSTLFSAIAIVYYYYIIVRYYMFPSFFEFLNLPALLPYFFDLLPLIIRVVFPIIIRFLIFKLIIKGFIKYGNKSKRNLFIIVITFLIIIVSIGYYNYREIRKIIGPDEKIDLDFFKIDDYFPFK